MDVIDVFSQTSQVLWAVIATLGSLISVQVLTPLNQKIADQAIPANAAVRTAQTKRVVWMFFGMSITIGILSAPWVRLPTPIINHYLYHQPVPWGQWWEDVGKAVLRAIAFVYAAQVVLHRIFRPVAPIRIAPILKERLAVILYDATLEVGLVLFGWLLGFLWITQYIHGTPLGFFRVCGASLLSIGFHVWTSTLLRGFTWMMFWTTVSAQIILVAIFGTLVMHAGIEAGAVGRALTVAVFIWPGNRRATRIAPGRSIANDKPLE